MGSNPIFSAIYADRYESFATVQGYSSVGRAVVSKTTCRGFESYCPCHMDKLVYRGVAQFGSATGLGPVGRGFKSCHPDHLTNWRARRYSLKRSDSGAISSVGQSVRLITGRSGVQVPDGPPI